MLRENIYTLLLPSIPAVGALLCLFIVGLVHADTDRRLLKRILVCFFLSEVGLWVSSVFYNHAPGVFVYLSSLSYFTMLLTQVTFFHFVFCLTQRRSNEGFSALHYIIPLVIAGVQGVWTLLLPLDVTLGLIESKGVPSADYPAYSTYFLFKIKMRMLYSLVYAVWALVRIYRYRRAVVNYSADEERTPLTWLKALVFITVILVLLPLSMVFHERSYFFSSTFLLPLMSILILVQFALLCFNFVTGNYVQISSGSGSSSGSEALHPRFHAGGDFRLHAGGVSEKMVGLAMLLPEEDSSLLLLDENFQDFMCSNKPYLNPQLRIIDLAMALGTNRSYLSAFINSTYGVNFSQLINRYRLEEFRRLEQEHPEINKTELAVLAGFGSYRSLTRVMRESRCIHK